LFHIFLCDHSKTISESSFGIEKEEKKIIRLYVVIPDVPDFGLKLKENYSKEDFLESQNQNPIFDDINTTYHLHKKGKLIYLGTSPEGCTNEEEIFVYNSRFMKKEILDELTRIGLIAYAPHFAFLGIRSLKKLELKLLQNQEVKKKFDEVLQEEEKPENFFSMFQEF